MSENQYESIVSHLAILNGKPCVKGTRVSVEHVLDHLASGWSIAAIIENYPNVTASGVSACIAYARDVVAGEAVFPNAA